MGYGGFSTSSSAARASVRMATGTTAFKHDVDAKAGRVAALHPSLDLRKKQRRECRDNDDNPQAYPIAIFVDVTGSMGAIAGYVIDNLNKAVSVIQGKGVVEHPSLLFGAVGDAYSDQVPIQVGEFESSDELAELHLSNIYREGNGGGQSCESYDIALWFIANQIDTDEWDKRGSKGIAFIIGDEGPYPRTLATQISTHCAVNIGEDVPLAEVIAKASERWEIFLLRPGSTMNFSDHRIKEAWEVLLPKERVIDVADWNEIVPMIAGTISVIGGLSLDDTIAAMKDASLSTAGVTTALATVANSAAIAVAGATDLAESDEREGATRL